VSTRWTAGVVAVLLATAALLAPNANAFPFANVAATFFDTVVGQTTTVSLGIQNSSTDPEATQFPTMKMAAIDLYPSCTVNAVDCGGGTAEPGVYDLAPGPATSGTGTGQSINGPPGGNPTCESGNWTLVPDNPDPALATRWRFIPPGGEATLILAVNEVCAVTFDVITRRVPTNDTNAAPGVQTRHATGVTPILRTPAGVDQAPQGRQGLTTENTISPATPLLSTLAAQAGAQVPGTTTDTATLDPPPPPSSGLGAPPQGSIKFDLFGPFAAGAPITCAGGSFATQTVPVNGFADYTTGPVNITTAGTYTWVATYSGDLPSYPAGGPTACGDPAETVTFAAVQPTIVTTASPSPGPVPPGTNLSDAATLSGGFFQANTPPGTIVFNLYGPFPAAPTAASCTAGALFATRTVNGVAANGVYNSGPVASGGPGFYTWVASYTPGAGDPNNLPASNPCGETSETTQVNRAQPTMTTAVSAANVAQGGSVTDTATVTGLVPGAAAPGTISFAVYGPFPLGSSSNCTTTPVTLGSPDNPVTADGNYTSTAFSPPGAGRYFFRATYTGDANNLPFTTGCGDANEQFDVAQAQPNLVTQASNNPPAAPAPLGSAISDTATISGLVAPVVAPAPGAGTIVFTAYGPDDPTCTTVAFSSTRPVPGNGAISSAPPAFTPILPGTYRWIAVYSGDANNAGVSTVCADPLESSVVVRSQPTIVTQASNNPPAAPATVGSPISDTATISGLNNPIVAPAPGAGTIVFAAYGPNNTTCAGSPVFTSTRPVPGNGSISSSPPVFTPTAPGTYRWIADYSGDVNNLPATTACADPLESSVVVPAQPQIVTRAFGPVTLSQPIRDTATLSGGVATPPATGPTGTIMFSAFGPGNSNCVGQPAFTSTVPVNHGNGDYVSADFTPTAAGDYDWVAVYSGDANNLTVTSPCGSPNETSPVIVQPTINVDKTATPPTRTAPGGDFTFNVVVTNSSAETLTITSLTDDVYGDLTTRANSTCTNAIGTVLAPNATYSCQFTAPFNGAAGDSQTDVVTVRATNPRGVTVTDSDDAVVSLTPVPTIVVDKTATPLTRPEPGGDFTFNVLVTNTSAEALTITSLTDDVYGNLATRAGSTCNTAIGTVLAASPGPGNTYSCSFTGPFTGNAGDSQTDVVTVRATNSQGVEVTDNDDAVVSLTNVPPAIQVVKTASPLTRPEPGGDFTYTVVVTNTGTQEAVTITALTDNVYGNLATRAGSTCNTAIGTVLQPSPGPGNTYTCTFTAPFTGNAGDSLTDIVTVTGVDNDNTTVTDTDDATVSLTDVRPTIAVVKTATPASLPEPGGAFTFNVVVTNLSNESVRITSLTDNVYGNIANQGTCTTAVGTTLAAAPGPGNTYSCSFTGNFTGNAGDTQTDIVTANAVDNDGDTATATDDATVAITNVLPAIQVEKSAVPTSRPQPGGAFQFNVVVSNIGPEALTITSLTDDIYGNIANQGTCTTAVGTVLQPGASYSCSFTGNFTGNAGASQTDIVTVTGVDNDNSSVTDTDDATVTITNGPPTVNITKTPSPSSLPEPGGQFTFTFVVTNTSAQSVTITSLTDDVYGNLNGRGTCATGAVLAPGAQYTCSFTVTFTGPPGATQRDVATVRVVDNTGQQATDDDDAVISITDVPPLITVQKTANPLVRNEPGGTFTFNVVITNVGPEAVTITDLTDDVYGNLNGRGTCAVGAVLNANGGTYNCSFTADFFGNAGATQTDIVTASGVDNDNSRTTARDDAVVRLVDVPPTVTVIKDADPASRVEPGGPFTFLVTVTNTSFEPVTLVSLTDDVYGNLNGRGTCAIGAVLPPGGSYKCQFTVDFRAPAGSSQVDRVFATVVDNDNSRATANDEARISITPAPPTVVQPVVVVTAPPPPPPVVGPILVRTGTDVRGPARLALALLMAGLLLVGATWGADSRRRLAFAPGGLAGDRALSRFTGPRPGPRSGTRSRPRATTGPPPGPTSSPGADSIPVAADEVVVVPVLEAAPMTDIDFSIDDDDDDDDPPTGGPSASGPDEGGGSPPTGGGASGGSGGSGGGAAVRPADAEPVIDWDLPIAHRVEGIFSDGGRTSSRVAPVTPPSPPRPATGGAALPEVTRSGNVRITRLI